MLKSTSKLCIKCDVGLIVGENFSEKMMLRSDYRCKVCRAVGDKENHYRNRVGTPQAKAKELARQLKWKLDNKGYVNHINNIRYVKKKQRMPSWANPDAIRKIYEDCAALNEEHGPRSHHVDHIIPLQGKTVSGLHVENNLQILKASDNIKKSNKYEQ
jgi:5-methylcytosine-specific restriction endonuclease McrA